MGDLQDIDLAPFEASFDVAATQPIDHNTATSTPCEQEMAVPSRDANASAAQAVLVLTTKPQLESEGQISESQPWRWHYELFDALAPQEVRVHPYSARYQLPPHVRSRRQKRIFHENLVTKMFASFPAPRDQTGPYTLPCILLPESHVKDARVFVVDAYGADVTLFDFIRKAATWMVEGVQVGYPRYVGARLGLGEFVIKVSGVPSDLRALFIKVLPRLMKQVADHRGSKTRVHVKDAWELWEGSGESRRPSGVYDLLVQVTTRDGQPCEDVDSSATGWPGWLVWRKQRIDLHLMFQQRFPYCTRCKTQYDRRREPHITRLCPRNHCTACRGKGHRRSECPTLVIPPANHNRYPSFQQWRALHTRDQRNSEIRAARAD
ncbi:unnamed protein product [Jaminaea pallidilutea]